MVSSAEYEIMVPSAHPPDEILISRSACLSIIAAAAEVFPKECMGSVCTEAGDSWKIIAAIPYQCAKRTSSQVVSESPEAFEKMFKHGTFRKLGDFHSHPFKAKEHLDPLAPSTTDLESLCLGCLELIVRIRKVKKKTNSWRQGKNGRIYVGWNQFRCVIGAFVREKGTEDEELLYNDVRLSLFD